MQLVLLYFPDTVMFVSIGILFFCLSAALVDVQGVQAIFLLQPGYKGHPVGLPCGP